MSGRGKSQRSIELIDAAARILEEIQPATVRAVCYRLFIEGLISSMSKSETNRVSSQLVYARENGYIPWRWIVDETRAPETVSTWSNPLEIFEAVARQYRFDHWTMQPERVEVWSEKGTVRGTLAPILDQYAVTLRVMHGHASATALKDAASASLQSDKPLHVLYVGDYDPSGLHMSELDLPERIDRYGGSISLERIAIWNEADAPSFPASDKRADPRYAWFVSIFGPRCWELDALSPVVLRERVEAAIRDHLDLDAWKHAENIEAAQRQTTATYVAGLASISGPATKYQAPDA